MSERNQTVVILIVALLAGAFVDRITALKIAAGVVLLWSLQNQPAVLGGIRKLFSLVRQRLRSGNIALTEESSCSMVRREIGIGRFG